MQYKILKLETDVKDSLIQKKGITSEFTINDIERHEAKLEKSRKELEGKVLVEKAKCTNIEEFHPFIKDMSEQDRVTVHTYQESYAVVVIGEQKLKEIEDQIKAYKEEKELIIKSLNLNTDGKEPTESKE